MTERMVERINDPHSMTGKVMGASEDGAQLAVLWSDNVLRVERAADLADYEPRASGRPPRISQEILAEVARVACQWPDGIHTCAELQELEPGRRRCTCGRCDVS